MASGNNDSWTVSLYPAWYEIHHSNMSSECTFQGILLQFGLD